MARSRRPLSPLDRADLERLALRYVERFATTRARLAAYLDRKIRERGWAGEGSPDTVALAQR
ncbi:MAG TPA: RecX family transcriptional regulator, partial [Sphingomonas sp.]|nr:RecX family transcriptional regulator [Sphingomonas sp.]